MNRRPNRYCNALNDSARWDGFPFRADDIVISVPVKCGTTWMQTICALLIFQEPAFGEPLESISPWLDLLTSPREQVVAALERQRHRRFIKTHTPLDGLPVDDRVTYICVARDPRDVALSLDNHGANVDLGAMMRVLRAAGAPGAGDDSAGPPRSAAIPGSAIQRFWHWVDDDCPSALKPASLRAHMHHLSTFWIVRDQPNIIMLRYEDLLKDLSGQMELIATRLGITVPAHRWPELVDAATFASMRSRADVLVPGRGILRDNARFFHRGTSGQWADFLDQRDLARYRNRVTALAEPDLVSWLHDWPLSS